MIVSISPQAARCRVDALIGLGDQPEATTAFDGAIKHPSSLACPVPRGRSGERNRNYSSIAGPPSLSGLLVRACVERAATQATTSSMRQRRRRPNFKYGGASPARTICSNLRAETCRYSATWLADFRGFGDSVLSIAAIFCGNLRAVASTCKQQMSRCEIRCAKRRTGR